MEATTMKTKNFGEIEQVISKAIKKVNGKKENDLCKYIPGDAGGYMHHFTLKKMKHRFPHELSSLLEKFILNAKEPASLPPKQRAARGSRKKKDHLVFSRMQLDKILTCARSSGNKELLSLIVPKRSLAACKKELLSSIRQGKVEQELWLSYVEAVQEQENFHS